jgi:hypothetical protein
MFELNVQNVVAGGEVTTGQASLLCAEHTVTNPLKNYPFTDTVGARGMNCGGGSATPRADGRFVIYIGLYGNRGDNPHAPLPVPRSNDGWAGNNNNLGLDTYGNQKGKTWKKPQWKECSKAGGRGGKLNGDQLHEKCVAKFENKRKAKKDNDGFVPI